MECSIHGDIKVSYCDECNLIETAGNKSALSDRVIKQFINQEIRRLEHERTILVGQGEHKQAQYTFHQIIGIQSLWSTLRQNGIAL